jgi:tripeptide aminopeptidase
MDTAVTPSSDVARRYSRHHAERFRLPQARLTPEVTDGRAGFIHLYHMSGSAAAVELHFALRDFEIEGLSAHGALVEQAAGSDSSVEAERPVDWTG